jgi:voltage-gated potassium channel
MAGLTGIYVVLSFSEDTAPLDLNPATLALLSLSVVFLSEFGARCFDAKSRLGYLRGHWLDLITSIPLIGPLRLLRLLRLLRFLRLGLGVRTVAKSKRRREGEDLTWLIWPFVLLFLFTSA